MTPSLLAFLSCPQSDTAETCNSQIPRRFTLGMLAQFRFSMETPGILTLIQGRELTGMADPFRANEKRV
jgi:hypothetical protein